MASLETIMLVQKCLISPEPATVPATSIPLTFFDIPFFLSVPCKRLFFFEFNHDSDYFMNHILTNLKRSLSISLHHFFPLAGYLKFPPLPAKPHLVYSKGNSVSLTVVESSSDFKILTGNQPRDCKEFLPLIAELPPPPESDGSVLYPLLALQVTIFPNSGICVSITYLHMIDGQTCTHFMKSWASVFNSGGDSSCLENSLPFYDRSIVKDPNGILAIYLQDWYALKCKLLDGKIGSNLNNVRATVSISRKDIEKMKLWISSQLKKPLQLSTFCVATSFIWVCIQKTIRNLRNESTDDKVDDDEIQVLAFSADCRNRPEYEIPTTYLGNCVVIGKVERKKCELLGENGLVLAAEAMANEIQKVKNGPLEGIEDLIKNFSNYSALTAVAGSPRFKLYETDFGWGKLKKSELVHVVDPSVISVSDHKDGNGGIEIGVVMTKAQMHTFSIMFEQGMTIFHTPSMV